MMRLFQARKTFASPTFFEYTTKEPYQRQICTHRARATALLLLPPFRLQCRQFAQLLQSQNALAQCTPIG